MAEPRRFSKVYHDLLTDSRFDAARSNPALLGKWLECLLISDAMWPIPAPMPFKSPTLRRLIELGLVVVGPGNTYSILGQKAERERRTDAARNAAASRWRNAESMPSRGEERRKSAPNADALRRDVSETYKPNGTPDNFMGFRPRKDPVPAPGERAVPIHDGRHGRVCLVCFPVEQTQRPARDKSTEPAKADDTWRDRQYEGRDD